ncbi:MAG: DUF3253 domain-containing protein [Umezawaea sp.]
MADERLRAELTSSGSTWAEVALSDAPVGERLEAALLALAEHRAPRTTCPSDAARAVGGADWRDLMDRTREIARDLARRGAVEITQRGEVLDVDEPWRGPIRIRSALSGR